MTTEATDFFYEHAGWGYHPVKETPEEGRRRGATSLADAEAWAKGQGVEFIWESDWSVGSHQDFYGTDSAYGDGEPETCESCIARLNGEVVASLSCIDGATAEYRRVVEAELAGEAKFFVEEERPRQELVGAADKLRAVLDTFNRHGDTVDGAIAAQANGHPYGEVFDGLRALLRLLFPDCGDRVLDRMFDNDETAHQAHARIQQES